MIKIYILLFSMSAFGVCGQTGKLGLFAKHGDVGAVTKPGGVTFEASTGAYLLSGSGENIWFTNDAFHFVWREASGDVSISARIHWPNAEGHPHKKAGLMIRQSLAPDAAYADVVVHGDGLASLQCRETNGSLTREVQSLTRAPERLRLEKRGDYVSISLAADGEELRPAGGSFRVRFAEPFLLGLAVCAHDSNAVEQASFSDVEIAPLQRVDPSRMKTRSTLEVISIYSGDRKVVYHTPDHIEAPNWSRDGQSLLFNSVGRLYKIPVAGGIPELVDTGFATKCNNDHGISPDGKWLVISDQTGDGKSRIHVVPTQGGSPRLVTELGPSYWHGWSPDGRTLAYCAERKGVFDVYTIPVEGGQEKRLTHAEGLDDGPDYSPDGQWIYFNSERTGLMQVWRMRPDGSDQQAVTSDRYNNWFPHPSPDGKWLVFLSYAKEVTGHPANKDVVLRLMRLSTGKIDALAHVFGGQGTLNVPSWSPDSRSFAFVSYQSAAP